MAETIVLYTIEGQMIETVTEAGKQLYSITTSEYPIGIYLLRITYDDGTTVSNKILITH
jgi:hypothetical protein